MDTETVELKEKCDYHAPDVSEIYKLADGSKGGLCQCILPVGGKSKATSHKTVEEVWYFVEGQGEAYRRGFNNDKPTAVKSGTSLVIPVKTTFQFRNIGEVPLKFIIATMPPWPGPSEAKMETGIW